jgi:hypothetical protein
MIALDFLTILFAQLMSFFFDLLLMAFQMAAGSA